MFARPYNPKRPHGDVHGLPGVAFDQDGQLYNAQKQPVDDTGKVLPVAAAPASAPEKPVAAPAVVTGSDEDDIPEDEKGIDLLAWANDSPDLKGLPWQTVRLEAQKILEDISELKSKAALKQAIIDHYAAAA